MFHQKQPFLIALTIYNTIFIVVFFNSLALLFDYIDILFIMLVIIIKNLSFNYLSLINLLFSIILGLFWLRCQ